MLGTGWPAEASSLLQTYGGPVHPAEETSLMPAFGGPVLPEELRQVARGEAALAEAMLTLARYAEEQALTAADLLERETWALTAILERSMPIWRHLPNPTLRFVPDHSDQPRLELGSFSHLAALIAPSADEQALIAATAPCWARVSSAPERQVAGQTGALACSYVAISPAEAVATLGLGRILTQIEVATRTAGQALVAQAQAQRDRQSQLLRAERMLGVDPDPATMPTDCSRPISRRLALLLLESAKPVRLALAGVLWGFIAILTCFLVGIPQAIPAVLVSGVGALLWLNAS